MANRRKRPTLLVLIIGLLLVALIAVSSLAGILATAIANYNYCSNISNIVSPGSLTVSSSKLTTEQLKNASMIVSIGLRRGFSFRDIKVALMTAYKESTLRNLSYGDRDSLGLYQQRPSQGWGTADQILDPVYAINKFYDALAKVKDRDAKPLMEVAIEVQRPSRQAYTSPANSFMSWESLADEIIASRTTPQTNQDPSLSVNVNRPTPQAVPEPPTTYDGRCQPHQPSDASQNPTGSNGAWSSPLESMQPVTSPYGLRFHPILHTWRMHYGMDIGVSPGTPIRAMQAGTVTYTGYTSSGGNTIKISYGGGNVSTYEHMIRPASVAVGDHVTSGEVVGNVGSTGWSTAPHLHIEWLINGKNVDPLPQLCSRNIIVPGANGCASVNL